MKKKTRELTQQVREVLLVLSDDVLMETLSDFLTEAEEYLLCLTQNVDLCYHYRHILGYLVQSKETGKIYESIFDLGKVEPEHTTFISWIEPEAKIVRKILADFTINQVYHIVIRLAGMALSQKASKDACPCCRATVLGLGEPPSTGRDGYGFIRNLAVYLCNQDPLLEVDEEDNAYIIYIGDQDLLFDEDSKISFRD